MNNSAVIESFKRKIGDSSNFSTQQLSTFLKSQLPDLQESTIGWRINQLKNEGFIFQIGRGIYSFEGKPEYEPTLSLKGKRLYNRVAKLVPDMKLVMWELEMLDELLAHSEKRCFYFISTKKENLETLFDKMLGFSKKVFLNPDNSLFNRYILPLEEAIILRPLVSEAPVMEVNGVHTPTLEGLLVDVSVKDRLILENTGNSIEDLFQQAIEKYNINQSKLLRYAARRDKRTELEKHLKNLTTQ